MEQTERGGGGSGLRWKWKKVRRGDLEGNRTKGGRNRELNGDRDKYRRNMEKKRARWASDVVKKKKKQMYFMF